MNRIRIVRYRMVDLPRYAGGYYTYIRNIRSEPPTPLCALSLRCPLRTLRSPSYPLPGHPHSRVLFVMTRVSSRAIPALPPVPITNTLSAWVFASPRVVHKPRRTRGQHRDPQQTKIVVLAPPPREIAITEVFIVHLRGPPFTCVLGFARAWRREHANPRTWFTLGPPAATPCIRVAWPLSIITALAAVICLPACAQFYHYCQAALPRVFILDVVSPTLDSVIIGRVKAGRRSACIVYTYGGV